MVPIILSRTKIPGCKNYYSPILESIYSRVESLNFVTHRIDACKHAAYTLRNNALNDCFHHSYLKRVF